MFRNSVLRFVKSNTLTPNTKKTVHPASFESFLTGTSCIYLEELHRTWMKDPNSVHTSWQTVFKVLETGAPLDSIYNSPHAGTTVKVWTDIPRKSPVKKAAQPKVLPGVTKAVKQAVVAPATKGKLEINERMNIEAHLNLFGAIYSYQKRGHLMAALDPLNLVRGPLIKKHVDTVDNLIIRSWKLPSDMTKMFELPLKNNFIGRGEKFLSIKEIINRLEESYCQSVGVEMIHVSTTEEKLFIEEQMETKRKSLSSEEKLLALKRLCYAHHFEFFLSKKWPAEKRFGLEGCEVYVPAMRHIIELANDFGADYFVIGMAHRARLNTLVNIMEKSLTSIFTQFQPLETVKMYGEGDVKYHLGTATTIKHAKTNKTIGLSLCDNASHLESVNPIVLGKTACDQIMLGDTDKTKVWPILVHGDAAVCGQGVVYETMHLAELKHYKTGGTIHVVINNQIGFTTDPYLSRSSEYCTAVGKVVDAPIFHVNADDVEAVLFVCEIAVKYRKMFQNCVIIDLICYRKFGHNEVDEPMFTQPFMYTKISQMKPIYEKYKEKLIAEQVATAKEVEAHEERYFKQLEDAFQEASLTTKMNFVDWISSPWPDFFNPSKDPLFVPNTGVDESVLEKIGVAFSTPPQNFQLHKGIQRIFRNREIMLTKAKIADWAIGEAFAFGSLLQEGIPVRLAGQDCERGTFSHRHHVLHDQETGKRINVLLRIFPNQATYTLVNSSLSEFGVLGFELGMALVNPRALFMWEGQFGDFFNSAQVIFDQYLSSGQAKWYRHCGLVCLLPHGLEGQGPEHSSGRPERFLQGSNDDDTNLLLNMPQQLLKSNWFIVNASEPANFFHALRRQVKINFRKPLIVFTPKALLRLPECVSPLSDFVGDTRFRPYIPDPNVPPSGKVKKLLLCTGKVYFELKATREQKNLQEEIAIGRIEQLCPLPYEEVLRDATINYPNASVTWVQEEHKNQGGWSYISPRINRLLGKYKGALNYVGRQPAASPATGHKLVYPREREQFLVAAMT